MSPRFSPSYVAYKLVCLLRSSSNTGINGIKLKTSLTLLISTRAHTHMTATRRNMPSSLWKVLNTPELFELILLQCELRTLLTAALRVNHQWHDVMRSSPAIQELMFFRPSTRREGSEFTFNPVLVEDFGLFFDGQVHTRESFEALPIAKAGKSGRRKAFMCTGPSWRSMLVCQPPIRSMGHWYCATTWPNHDTSGSFSLSSLSDLCSCNERCESCKEVQAAGEDKRDLNLTMGMLYDEGVRTGTSGNSPFTYFWNPKAMASFTFAGSPDDPRVYTWDGEIGEEDYDDPKLLSELVIDVDLLQAMRVARTCIMGGGLSKFQSDFRNRFKFPQCWNIGLKFFFRVNRQIHNDTYR